MPDIRKTYFRNNGPQPDVASPFCGTFNPFGAPWCFDGRNIRRSSNNEIVGVILPASTRGDSSIAQWICGAAEIAQVLYPLSLEATSHIKPFSRSITKLVHAMEKLMETDLYVIREVSEGGINIRYPYNGKGWWEFCKDYASTASTYVSYDTAQHMLHSEDWKHSLGRRYHASPGAISLQNFDPTSGNNLELISTFDGTSSLYAGTARTILFRTNAQLLNEECPQAVPLFVKFLRRILKQVRSDNPLAPPELPSKLADAIVAIKPNLGFIDAAIAVCERSETSNPSSDIHKVEAIKQARGQLNSLKSMSREMSKGTPIADVLSMPLYQRMTYYESLRKKWHRADVHDLQKQTSLFDHYQHP